MLYQTLPYQTTWDPDTFRARFMSPCWNWQVPSQCERWGHSIWVSVVPCGVLFTWALLFPLQVVWEVVLLKPKAVHGTYLHISLHNGPKCRILLGIPQPSTQEWCTTAILKVSHNCFGMGNSTFTSDCLGSCITHAKKPHESFYFWVSCTSNTPHLK